MKTILYLLFFLFSFLSYSQPGDIIGMKTNRINEINSLLEIDTNNHQLLWERLELIFNPHFDIYTKTRKNEPVTETSLNGKYLKLYTLTKNVNVLDDLNYLLNNAAVIIPARVSERSVTSANLHYKRGQYYYLHGEPKKALNDYLTAIHANPNPYLINKICISIAAYYYNLSDGDFNLSNFEKALEYIDVVIPEEIENTPETFSRFTDQNHHPFEQEKIMLLELTGKKERLKNYHKSLAKSHLNLYAKDIEKSDEYQKNHSYTIPHTLETGLSYLFKIAQQYYKEEDFKKAEQILESITSYIPKQQINQPKYTEFHLLLQDIYAKKCCKNTLAEIENIFNFSGIPNYNLRTKNVSNELNKIEQLLKIHPNNPKLFLAKAIFLHNSGNKNQTTTIINLLDSTKKFGLSDYRIPYLKGLIFKQQLKYKEALNEFDKSTAINSNIAYPYRGKLDILNKIPNYDNAKLVAIQIKIKALPLPISPNIKKLINKIDEF